MTKRSERWELALVAVLSVFGGIAIVMLGQMDLRWFVFATGGALLLVAAMAVDLEKIFTAAFIVGLSVDAHYYLTTPVPMLYTGLTTPSALYVQVSLIPGLILLARQTLVSRSGGPALDWAPALTVPMLWVLATSLASMGLSRFKFAGLCVVWQSAALYLLFVVTVNLVRSREMAHRATTLLLVSAVGQCAVFFLQLATGMKFNAVGKVEGGAAAGASILHAASGTAASTTAGFGMFMDPLVMLAYALYRTQPRSGRKRIYAGIFLLGMTALALTLNRSTWLAIPIGMGVTELLLRRRGVVERRTGRRGRLTLAPIAVLAILLAAVPLFQSSRKGNVLKDDLEQRFDLMGPARAMIERNPVLGVGPGAYGYVLREYAAGHAGWLYIAHNDYLLIGAERGIVGFMAWLAFLWAFGRELMATTRRRNAWDATMGVAAVGGFAMQLCEVFWTAAMSFPSYGVMYVILGICAGLNHHVLEEEDRPMETTRAEALPGGTVASMRAVR